ncbi:MAG: hypothetical protein Q7R95_08855 [bacterium]|nr:hypothetical protein [bacterium]
MNCVEYCRKYIIILFILLSTYLLVSKSISAQPKLSERWVCLSAIHCWEQKAESAACVTKNGHRALLSAKGDLKPLSNQDTYIVEALATATGEVRTAGTKQLDEKIFGKDNEADLLISDKYEFQGLYAADAVTPITNPIKSKNSGDIDQIYWQSYSKGNERKFLAMNYVDSTNFEVGTGALQQASFTFEGAAKNCVSINWDPYGKVFDAESLEPIYGIQVELQKKRVDGQFTRYLSSEMLGGQIENPFTTKEDGAFSFVVPDGLYKLAVSNIEFDFPVQLDNVNKSYSKLYSDIYPAGTGEVINQQGKIQHRDIPLKFKLGSKTYPVKLMEYFYSLNKEVNKVTVQGIVSHSLTTIKIYSLKPSESSTITNPLFIRSRLIKTIQADKFGKFIADIDQSGFMPTEIFGEIELEKYKIEQASNVLTLIDWFVKKVDAQQSDKAIIRFDPILNKINGYAYDVNGSLLTNTIISIYLNYSNKSYFETKTDEKGYYEIPSVNVPDSPYRLKYSLPNGGTQSVSTSKFIAQNKIYIEKTSAEGNVKSSIKPNLFGSNITPKATIIQTTNTPIKSISSSPLQRTNTSIKTTQNNNIILLFAVLLLLFAGVGGLLFYYISHKKKTF